MANKFTVNQQRAIDDNGHNILIAASAGSGKTTVLIERLIRKIVGDEENNIPPTSVDRFLIVTFTNAAAKEMRERLERTIEEKLQECSEEMARFLHEQLLLLPAANISTIDAYALRLIENYYHVIGLDPKFRLMSDTAERDMMRQDVLNEVFEAYYDEKNINHDAFINLVNNFGSPIKDNELKKAILKLSDFAEARPDGVDWLTQLADNDLANMSDLTDTKIYQDCIKKDIQDTLVQLLNDAQHVINEVSGVPELPKTQEAFEAMSNHLKNVKSTVDEEHTSWDNIRNQLLDLPQLTIERSSASIKEDVELSKIHSYAKSVKEVNQSEIKRLVDTFFKFGQEEWTFIAQENEKLTRTLVMVTQDFQREFTAAKRQSQLVDFPDLGALALQILKDDDTRQTVSGQFDEILIDEYQDINQLQETLLKQLSNGHNMYMVGDVKQSIYGFRQAEPTLFTRKYHVFSDDSNDDKRIELADNFRSHNNVTRAINLIFTQLMDEQLGDIAYTGEAKLVPKASYPDELPPVFNIDILQQESANDTESDQQDDDNGDSTVDFENRQAQYAHIAHKITQLLQSNEKIFDRKRQVMRPIQYGDIAILTRAKTGYIDMVNILRSAGIPVQVDAVGNYFQTMEVYLVLDVLRIIDNPHQDIPLAAVLRSPMFNYDENDLAAIRVKDKSHDFWTALTEYAQYDERSQHFLKLINQWRDLAGQNDLVSLIWAIFDDTAWLDYVAGMPGGAQRQANLHALYDYARSYQENNHAGLFRFIRYVEQLQENDNQLGEAPQEADEQAVRIMTIHASKGLEFPIVFLPEVDKTFNDKDTRGGVLIQKNAGIGLEYLQTDAFVSIPTLNKLVVKQAIKKQSWSEEMRLLYVALTRAEQQVHIIGTAKVKDGQPNDPLVQLWQQAKETSGQFLAERTRLKAQTYLEWLIIALARAKNNDLEEWLGDGQLPRLVGSETALDADVQVNLIPEKTVKIPEDHVVDTVSTDYAEESYQSEDYNQAKALLDYNYPFIDSTQTAAYQSVSEMKRLFEDPDQPNLQTVNVSENGQIQPAHVLVNAELSLPTFMTDGTQRPSQTAVGTATHLLLQLLDFSQEQTQDTLTELLNQLIDSNQINEAVAALINIDHILDFLGSPFAKRIAEHADTLYREATFSMIMPANQIYEQINDNSSVLVHGIIDGYFIDEATKSITLFDYKTDYIHHNQVNEDLKKLVLRYRGQLRLYQQALQQEYPDYTFYEPQLVALQANRLIGVSVK